MAKKIILICLAICSIVFTFSYCSKTCSTGIVKAITFEDESESDLIEAQDDNFFIDRTGNTIYTGDSTGKTMLVKVYTQEKDYAIPYETTKSIHYKCNFWGCDAHDSNNFYRDADFNSATLSLKVYAMINGKESKVVCEYILTCKETGIEYNNGFEWAWEYVNYFPEVETVPKVSLVFDKTVNGEPILQGGASPFILSDDFYYNLNYLITSPSGVENYKVSFEYDYYFYRYWNGVGSHNHAYKGHNQSVTPLKRATGSSLSIFENIRKIENTDEKLLRYFNNNDELLNNLLSLYNSVNHTSIYVSFLKGMEVNGKELPFAYRATYLIEVPIYDGEIKFEDVMSALYNNGYITEEYERNLLKCLNSNLSVEYELSKMTEYIGGKDYFSLKYNASYTVHFKNSSGDVVSQTLSLVNFYDYYKNFAKDSNTIYNVLDSKFFEAVFNNILNSYGLSEPDYYVIPEDGSLNAGKPLSIKDLYGYFGFALVPRGGGIDTFLSKYFNGRLNSNGITIPLSAPIILNKKQFNSLTVDYGYSCFDTFFSDLKDEIEGGSNATYYLFYVSEISNDFVYVISENGSLSVHNVKGLTENKVINSVSSVFNKIGSIFSNSKVLIILALVVIVILFFFLFK